MAELRTQFEIGEKFKTGFVATFLQHHFDIFIRALNEGFEPEKGLVNDPDINMSIHKRAQNLNYKDLAYSINDQILENITYREDVERGLVSGKFSEVVEYARNGGTGLMSISAVHAEDTTCLSLREKENEIGCHCNVSLLERIKSVQNTEGYDEEVLQIDTATANIETIRQIEKFIPRVKKLSMIAQDKNIPEAFVSKLSRLTDAAVFWESFGEQTRSNKAFYKASNEDGVFRLSRVDEEEGELIFNEIILPVEVFNPTFDTFEPGIRVVEKLMSTHNYAHILEQYLRLLEAVIS